MNRRETVVTIVKSRSVRGASLSVNNAETARWITGQTSDIGFRFDLHLNPGRGQQPHVILYVRQAPNGLRCSADFQPSSLTDGFSWNPGDREVVRQAYEDLLAIWRSIEA